jgi:hypothetical protein
MITRPLHHLDRRQFLGLTGGAAVAARLASTTALAQVAGERPNRDAAVTVLNPRTRVPVGIIIDDSTCLVNLNRFAMPQFDDAFGGANPSYKKPWREWQSEIPDAFIRRFGTWAAEKGVKGKFSIVPQPACVGRIDRLLPGWTGAELAASIRCVQEVMTPNWDIHPEMASHTRVIDPKTGHPYPEVSTRFMENWEWTTGRSADEIADYMRYALGILKNVGFHCDGITTPGGFGNKALPQLARATLQSVRDVFGTETPHYFRHLFDSGTESVAPRVEYAAGLDGSDPRCVVSIIGCTGDWTGGWDCTTPAGSDRFITADLQHGRMVEVIERGEPALMLAHWTGVYWNGRELGFNILREVVDRLHQRYEHLLWMKQGELARYWAARELTSIQRSGDRISFRAPFACPDFTLSFPASGAGKPRWIVDGRTIELREVKGPLALMSSTWCSSGGTLTVCGPLPKGKSELVWS